MILVKVDEYVGPVTAIVRDASRAPILTLRPWPFRTADSTPVCLCQKSIDSSFLFFETSLRSLLMRAI